MDDELCECRVERPVREGQTLCRRLQDVDSWVACSSSCDEWLGRVDGRHRFRPEPGDQLGRERAWPAADIEHPLAAAHPGEVGQLRG
jgi:hypothetical protein